MFSKFIGILKDFFIELKEVKIAKLKKSINKRIDKLVAFLNNKKV